MKKSTASASNIELEAARKFAETLPKAEFSVFQLTSKWQDGISKDGGFDGHFTVYLHMGNLNWDIKHEDFKDVKKLLASNGTPHNFIVHTGFTTHNSMTFQYVKKSQMAGMFAAIKEILVKRLSK